MKGLGNVCRLCLKVQKKGNLAGSIFDDGISTFLCEIFQLTMIEMPGWPSEACVKCHKFIEEIRSFREEVQNAYSTLCDMASESANVSIETEDKCYVKTDPESPVNPAMENDTVEIMPIEYFEDDNETQPSIELEQVVSPSLVDTPSTETLPKQKATGKLKRAPLERTRSQPTRKNKKEHVMKRSKSSSFSLAGEAQMEAGMREMGWLKCHLCGAETETVRAFNKHFHDTHNSYGYITCCNGKRRAGTQLYEHYTYHQNESAFKCELCQNAYRSRSLVKIHMQICHPDPSVKHYQCETCGKNFFHLGRFNNHKKRHELPLKCSYCGKGFPNNKQMERHIERLHEIANRAVCDKCGKWFSSQDTLDIHIRRHRWAENKQPCPHCGKMVADMKQHVNVVHLGTRRGGIIRIPGLDSQGRPVSTTTSNANESHTISISETSLVNSAEVTVLKF